jgi:hypothetical protein
MATLPPMSPLPPWTCPRCKAVWHSGRQYCVDCQVQLPDGRWVYPEQVPPQPFLSARPTNGPVLGPDGHPLSPLAPQQFPRSKEEALLEHSAQFSTLFAPESQPVTVQRDLGQGETGGTAPELAETLRRSMAAESALQAELTPLRERVWQLEKQLSDQRTQLLGGVQRLLEPLTQELLRQGMQGMQVSQLVPVAVQLLQQLKAEQAPEVLRTIRDEVRAMFQYVQQQGQTVPLAEHGAVESGPTGTFLITDRGAYDLEQALLRERDSGRGGMYGG